MELGATARLAMGNPTLRMLPAGLPCLLLMLPPLIDVQLRRYGLWNAQDELISRASFYCWMFLVIAVAAFLSAVVQQVAFGRVAQAVSGRVRVQLFGSILRQEVRGGCV